MIILHRVDMEIKQGPESQIRVQVESLPSPLAWSSIPARPCCCSVLSPFTCYSLMPCHCSWVASCLCVGFAKSLSSFLSEENIPASYSLCVPSKKAMWSKEGVFARALCSNLGLLTLCQVPFFLSVSVSFFVK